MVHCVAVGCANSTKKTAVKKRFFKFPDPIKEKKRHAQWVKRVNRVGWTPTHNSHLCEEHFAREAFLHPPHVFMEVHGQAGRLRLVDDAVPTMFKKNVNKVKTPRKSMAITKRNLREVNIGKLTN